MMKKFRDCILAFHWEGFRIIGLRGTDYQGGGLQPNKTGAHKPNYEPDMTANKVKAGLQVKLRYF